MATAATSLLGLALPVTGELSGTWGDTVNVSITALLDTAVAGTTTLSSDADVTLTTTTLAANQARQAIILWTAGGTVTRTITVPAQSKSYIVINKTSSSQSIKIVGVGPTTGVTIVAGTAAFVVWNGVDFVTVSVTSTTGILPVANGGTGLSSGTSGGVLAYTATGTLASSTALAASALVIGGGAGAAPSTTTTGTGVVTALGVNVGTAGAFVVNGGALGTPSSGTVTNLTGTASININGTVGATTPAAGSFTTLSATGTATFNKGATAIDLTPVSTAASARTNISWTAKNASSANRTTYIGSNIFLADGSTEISGEFAVNLMIDGVTKTALTSTGLEVTGTLSATGRSGVTMSGQTSAVSLGQVSTDPTYGLLSFNGAFAATTLTGIWGGAGSPDMIIGVPTGGSIYSRVNNSTVTLLNSTGLAVTGTLSATGTLSGGTSGTAYSFSGSAPATSLTLDSSGNLGIGTTSPVGRLEAVGGTGAGFNGWFRTGDTTAANNAGGGFYNTSSATAASRQAVMALDADGANLGGGDYFVIQKNGNSGTADILQYSNAAMRFGTNYTARAAYDMTLDSSGNLGLGVTPSAWDTVIGSQVGRASIYGYAGNEAGFQSNCYFGTGNWRHIANGTAEQIRFESGEVKFRLGASGTAGNAISFTQAMTLDASGNLLVGTTSFNYAANGVGLRSNAYSYFTATSATPLLLNLKTTTGTIVSINFDDSGVGSISTNGTVTLYNTTSDLRLKNNIQDAAPASALIDAIRVRQFDWKSDGSHQRYGFVAQELVTVAPEAVHAPADPDEMMAVDYSKLVPLLVKELQSLRARVAQLESKP